jgi:hypothetical protein
VVGWFLYTVRTSRFLVDRYPNLMQKKSAR